MESPDLDFEALLAPIAGDNPAGDNLRLETEGYPLRHRIKDERERARHAEREADMFPEADELDVGLPEERPDPSPHWRAIIDYATDVLINRSKDLEIAAYMAEALVRRFGFAGLRDGFRLIRELTDRYWEDLYPHPAEDEDAIEVKVKPLADLNGIGVYGALIEPIRKVHITEADAPGPFATWHFLGATDPSRSSERRQGIFEELKASARATPLSFYQEFVPTLLECEAEFDALGKALEQRLGGNAPPNSNIRDALAEVRKAVQFATEDLPAVRALFDNAATGTPDDNATANEGNEEAAVERQAGGKRAAVAGDIQSREDALLMLLRIARYFRETEPHAPISYTLEEAVRRARLSFPELLAELIPDATMRADFFRRAGIEAPADATIDGDG